MKRTAYVILGMLRLGRTTGYEIKQLVDVSTRFFWAASYGQIYPELARLEDAGLIRASGAEGGGRRRKTYALTRAGERELDEWLRSGQPLHFELRHEGVLKLFFSDSLDERERAAQWRRIREAHEGMAGQLRSIRPGAEERRPDGAMPLQVLDFGIAYHEFIVAYCTRMEDEEA